MMFRLVSNDGSKVMGQYGTDPVCGTDFCDECGCCLACFCVCPCCPQAVVYEDKLIEWMEAHGISENPFV